MLELVFHARPCPQRSREWERERKKKERTKERERASERATGNTCEALCCNLTRLACTHLPSLPSHAGSSFEGACQAQGRSKVSGGGGFSSRLRPLSFFLSFSLLFRDCKECIMPWLLARLKLLKAVHSTLPWSARSPLTKPLASVGKGSSLGSARLGVCPDKHSGPFCVC